MNSKVTALPGITVRTEEPNPRIVQAAKEILAAAESGKLQSLAATGFLSDGLRLSCLIPHENAYEMIGSIEHLKLRFVLECVEPL